VLAAGDLSARARSLTGAQKIPSGERASVLPITECPWCSSPLCIECVDVDEVRARLVIRCPDEVCPYSGKLVSAEAQASVDGLPLYVVDADVYKFAQRS